MLSIFKYKDKSYLYLNFKLWIGIFLVICFFLITLHNSYSQDSIDEYSNQLILDSNEHLIKYDSAYFEVRNFDVNKIEKFKKDKDFSYLSMKSQPFDLFSLILKLIDEYLSKPISRMVGNSNSPYILLVLIIFIFGSISFLLIRKKFNTGFDKNLKHNSNFNYSLHNIHEIDFDSEIEKAIQNSDYSTAIRFHYLKLLKILFKKELLQYRNSKTNSDYLNELRNTELWNSFRGISNIFNYVSYGKFSINADEYSLIINRFNDFSIRVNNFEKS